MKCTQDKYKMQKLQILGIIYAPQMMYVASHKHEHLICHSTDVAGFMLRDPHQAILDEIRQGLVMNTARLQ